MRTETQLNFQNYTLTELFCGLIQLTVFLFLLVLFIIHHSLIDLIIINQTIKQKYFLKSISWTSKIALKILNVKIKIKGDLSFLNSSVLVSNHLSYLDVMILFAYSPSLFITSTEVRDTFFLGRITKLAGCIFVERRPEKRTSETKNIEIMSLTTQMKKGFSIFFFPEGTSSKGKKVLPFKSTFFQIALDTNSKVTPLCLRYEGENSSIIPWFGDMTFLDHLYLLCMQDKIHAELTILSPVTAESRKDYALKTFDLISDHYERH